MFLKMCAACAYILCLKTSVCFVVALVWVFFKYFFSVVVVVIVAKDWFLKLNETDQCKYVLYVGRPYQNEKGLAIDKSCHMTHSSN